MLRLCVRESICMCVCMCLICVGIKNLRRFGFCLWPKDLCRSVVNIVFWPISDVCCCLPLTNTILTCCMPQRLAVRGIYACAMCNSLQDLNSGISRRILQAHNAIKHKYFTVGCRDKRCGSKSASIPSCIFPNPSPKPRFHAAYSRGVALF